MQETFWRPRILMPVRPWFPPCPADDSFGGFVVWGRTETDIAVLQNAIDSALAACAAGNWTQARRDLALVIRAANAGTGAPLMPRPLRLSIPLTLMEARKGLGIEGVANPDLVASVGFAGQLATDVDARLASLGF